MSGGEGARRQSARVVFASLHHPPGDAQVDFGEAVAEVRGRREKVAFLPDPDAVDTRGLRADLIVSPGGVHHPGGTPLLIGPRAAKVWRALMKMKKIDLAALEAAAEA